MGWSPLVPGLFPRGEGCQPFPGRQQLHNFLPSEAHEPLAPFQPLGDGQVSINQWHDAIISSTDLTMNPSGLVPLSFHPITL